MSKKQNTDNSFSFNYSYYGSTSTANPSFTTYTNRETTEPYRYYTTTGTVYTTGGINNPLEAAIQEEQDENFMEEVVKKVELDFEKELETLRNNNKKSKNAILQLEI